MDNSMAGCRAKPGFSSGAPPTDRHRGARDPAVLTPKDYGEESSSGKRGGIMEWLKGVHVIETYATTTLLVDDRLVLVDTSADADAGKVMDYLTHIRVSPKDLSTIFITHTHPDHVGGLGSIKKASQAKVAAHRIEADFISRQKTWDGPPGPQRHTPTPVD